MQALQGRRFWIAATMLVLAVAAMLAMANWQWSKGQRRSALQAALEAQAKQPAWLNRELLAAQAANGPDFANAGLHRRVELRGEWDPRTVYLDNRPMRGKSGFVVVTPLRLDGTRQSILVQRGWVARDVANPAKLPALETPSGPVTVLGRLAGDPPRLLELKDTRGQGPMAQPGEPGGPTGMREGLVGGALPTGPGSPGVSAAPAAGAGLIRHNLSVQGFAAETGLALMPVTVLQLDPAGGAVPSRPDGLLRDWPLPASGADKNFGYAFQWVAMALALVALFMWFQWGRFRVKTPSATRNA